MIFKKFIYLCEGMLDITLKVCGAGEMAPWLKVLAALPEDQVQLLHGGSQPSVTPVLPNLTPSHKYTFR